MEIKVFTAFAGYDSQCLALDRLKEAFPWFSYELVGWSEIDKYAIQAHNALYPQWAERNYGDISKVDWYRVPDFDLFTYSFPCTDISTAGKQEGLSEGSGTRSSLLWECRKAIEIKRPRWLLMENVKALVSEKFLPFFLEWEKYLRGLGYANYSKVLNAKDFGVPQNRERIFMVSVMGDEVYHFPAEMELKCRLKDVLEKDVDEKYYLSEKTIANFSAHVERKQKEGCGFKFTPHEKPYDKIAFSITTNAGGRETDNFIKAEFMRIADAEERKKLDDALAAHGLEFDKAKASC